MKILKCSLLIISLVFLSGTLKSQDDFKMLDQVYGLDQTLHNGEKYDYAPPPGTKGHQYLVSPDYLNGSVTLRGTSYHDVTLNFDIFNQLLLLRYLDETGTLNVIEISKAWLTTFSIGTMNFEFFNLDQEPRYFQVLGEGRVRILYYWRKNLDVDGAVGSYFLAFTRPVKDTYVLSDGKLKPFKNKRSLVKIFDPEQRPEIKNYLRKNKIRVNKASDKVIAEMITFIDNLR